MKPGRRTSSKSQARTAPPPPPAPRERAAVVAPPARGSAVPLEIWIAAAVLAAATAICYANALGNPFVFDDLEAIVRNPHVRSLSPLFEAMSAPAQSAAAGRPVLAFSLALNYAWGALSPWGYHLWNAIVHALNAFLLFLIVRSTLNLSNPSNRANSANANRAYPEHPANPAYFALAIALLWLVHPLQSELVDYVIQRSESMTAFFYFGALYASIVVMTEPERAPRWTYIAIAACALGMACKEVMVTAPVAILLFDTIFVAGSPKQAIRQRRTLYLGLASTWILLWLLIASGPRWRSAGFQSGISSWTYLLNQGEMLVTYLKLIVWPHPLMLDYGMTRPVSFAHAAPYGAVVLALLAVTIYALWRWPRAGFLGAWCFLTLAPSSSILPILTEVGAERRMYLPLAALITLLVVGGARVVATLAGRGQRTKWQPFAAGAVVALAVVWSFVTIQRNRDYHDLIALYTRILAERPHGRAHYSLAIALKDAGRVDEAIEEYRKSAVDFPDAHYALAYEYRDLGKLDPAIDEFRKFVMAVPLDGEVPNAFVLLGRTLSTAGRHQESVDAFRTALTMRPRNEDARGGLADALLAAQRYEEAVPAYRSYLQLAPGSSGAHGNLGLALIGLNKTEEAAAEFAKAVELAPNDAKLRMNHGYALASLGRLDEAAAEARSVLSKTPDAVDALDLMGVVLAAQGHRDEARTYFERALLLDPTNAQIREDAARALR